MRFLRALPASRAGALLLVVSMALPAAGGAAAAGPGAPEPGGAAAAAAASTGVGAAAVAGDAAGGATALSKLDAGLAFRRSQGVIGRPVGDYALLDRQGRQVRLAQYRGKPLLVNFVYTGCTSACPVATRRIAEAISQAQRTLGLSTFNVVSIGINPPSDSPESMREFARRFGLDSGNWEFLTPYERQLAPLLADFGFSFVPTSWGFDHITQVSVVDAEGRIYRQVYGEDFELKRLTDPVKELVTGTPLPMGSLTDFVERVRILCTIYDPASGAYRFNYSIIAQIIGITLASLTLLVYLGREIRARQRHRRLAP